MKNYKIITAVCALLLGCSSLAHAAPNGPPKADNSATSAGFAANTILGELPARTGDCQIIHISEIDWAQVAQHCYQYGQQQGQQDTGGR